MSDVTAAPRVRVDGKFFAIGPDRFPFRGVTYGTFQPRRSDGARYPEPTQVHEDLATVAAAGFTVIRTYTPPPEDLLQAAERSGLRVLAGVFYPDWRYQVGLSRTGLRDVQRSAVEEVRSVARRLSGDHRVLGISLGNEVPADVLRWFGTTRISRVLSRLVTEVRRCDPDQLVTYANYPTAEYLPLEEVDFLTFNVFLEHRTDFRRYLTRLHHLAGDRPLVLGELGLHAPDGPEGEQRQADTLGWQLETALERGVAGACVFSWTDEWWVGDSAVTGWRFGLTRADRSPRPALEVVRRANAATVRDLPVNWPTMTIVICAYNAAATLDECLRHTCSLDYPQLEILVVDDGSSDATADIARQHPRARLVSIEHGGLSVARNVGIEVAGGEIVAYLDSDAYPTPEWPWFLALAFDGRTVAGAGGPNLPPLDDPPGAHAVARSPGGPVHVLTADDRAEHVPGCNMAFWRRTLLEVGGFDPVYTSAGDDVDLCWKVLDAGGDIGFHPAALVWHHRRAGLRPYLRQQRGYGRSEALVEARHPDRFTPAGTARWTGHIYDSFAPRRFAQRIYRGAFGAAPYQSIYRLPAYGLDLAHQIGMPLAVSCLLTAPLGLLHPLLALPAVLAVTFMLGLMTIDAARARPPRHLDKHVSFRLTVAVMHLLQPLVRIWGRARHRSPARDQLPVVGSLPCPVQRLPRGVLLFPADRPRADLAGTVLARLRRRGFPIGPTTGWEDYDARVRAGALVYGDVVTSGHPEGSVQLRVRPHLRSRRLTAAVAVSMGAFPVSTYLSGTLLALTVLELGRGRRILHQALLACVPEDGGSGS